ncbi:MAG: hypothetical protein JST00_43825 [Deltaproteobacteria bacterium]|nr:hypothetical protein [Deltaproteobacteria bacterium]
MSALESSVTLEDIFSVVEAKRVPLAPELAGYLTLEIADGTQGTGGEVDPKTVYVSEEGTVALVRPKKDAPSGDTEASVRGILSKLLDASGSATPALTAAAKRKAGTGMTSLISELEAALIPVNRAAGRRALARLAREVKRVTLGVGRNASAPPVVRPAIRRVEKTEKTEKAESPEDVMSGPDAPPGPRGSFTDEAATAKRANQLADIAAQMNAPELVNPPKPAVPAIGLTPPPLPGAPAPVPPPPAPTARGVGAPAAAKGAALPPPPVKGPPAVAPPPPARAKGAEPKSDPKPAEKGTPDKLFGGDEVDSLLATFEVSSVGEKQMSRDLKAIAGLDPTPAPPDAQTLESLTKDIGKDLPKIAPRDSGSSQNVAAAADANDLDALLAMTDAPAKAPPPAPAAAPPPAPKKPDSAPKLPPASVLERREPAPSPPAPAAALAPPSPLVPMSPEPPPAPMVRPMTPGSVPELAASMSEALKRPVTPPRNIPAAAPSSTSSGNTGRHAKPAPESAAPPASSTRKSARPAKQTTGAYRQPRAPKTGLVMLVLTLLVLVGGGAAIWMWKPAFFTGKKRPVPTASTSAAPVTPPPPRCKVALVVTDVPANAEILLRMGQAPLDVERMPVGTRLEFVATAEGHAPRRAVVKADAQWEKSSDGKPRIDVPIQLDPSKAKPGALDPWPAAEPGSQVGGSGAPGTVHVLSTPRAAEIWLLAGLGPEARIEQLRCDGDIDVLLAGPPQLRKRLHVSEKDIQAATADPQGNRVVTVTGKQSP